MLANKRLSSYLPLILMLLLIFIVSFVLYYVGLVNKAPPGSDYGNYLTQVEILRGNDLRGWGLRHNPIFFVLLDMILRIFEEFTALKIVASLVFSVITIPFFLLARRLSGSRLASLICTWLLVLFISNFEMISWGGTPNFLGFSFMLLTLFFFVDLMEEPSKKNLLLSGFFFSLVVGTHILVAIYLLFSLFIFFIATTLTHKRISKVRIKSLFLMTIVTVVFSLPYFSFYLSFFQNSSNEIGENTLFSIPQISLSSLWGIVEFWDFFAVTIVFGLGLFALSKYVKEEHKNNGLILCSLSLSPFLLSLVTGHLFRWLYFLPIPLILCFGIYLRDLFFDIVWLYDNIKENIIIHAYKNVKNSRMTIYLIVVCFIAIIGFQIPVMTIRHYYQNDREHTSAPESYQFIYNDEIEALRWIKDNTAPNATIATSGHPKGTIGGGGNSYGWWIEGYSKRLCVFSGDLNYYSYQLERDEIRIANRIFAGTYSAEYNLSVTEAYPSSTTNPKIAAFIDNDYQDKLTLNDKQHQLFYSTNNNLTSSQEINTQFDAVPSDTITIGPHYLSWPPYVQNNNNKPTNIFLESASLSYAYSNVSFTEDSGEEDFIGVPAVVINATIRNDYRIEEIIQFSQEGISDSSVGIDVYLYNDQGDIEPTFQRGNPFRGSYELSLKSGETSSVNMVFATPNRNIQYFEIYVSYLPNVPFENEEWLLPAPFYSENRTSSIEYDETSANFTITYEQPYIEINRSVIISEEKSSVDVIFQILPKNSTLTMFKVNLWALFDTSLEDCEVLENHGVSLSQASPNEDTRVQIEVIKTNGNLNRYTVWFENTKESAPVPSYYFEPDPLQDNLYVHIRIFIVSPFIESPTEKTNDNQTFTVYNSYDLIEYLHIDYILINRYQAIDLFRIDSEHYTEVFQNDSIVIFKVN
ncbi:glycosyltransferase family 39 protein [Thermoproteota archaeon]